MSARKTFCRNAGQFKVEWWDWMSSPPRWRYYSRHATRRAAKMMADKASDEQGSLWRVVESATKRKAVLR